MDYRNGFPTIIIVKPITKHSLSGNPTHYLVGILTTIREKITPVFYVLPQNDERSIMITISATLLAASLAIISIIKGSSIMASIPQEQLLFAQQ